jgi:thiamine biosynthesis lipoprotein
VSRINTLNAGDDVTVGQDAFFCLKTAKQISRETYGIFDITVGNLVDFWKEKKSPKKITVSKIRNLYSEKGVKTIILSKKGYKVRSLPGGINLDLGGIGKGYALDRMAGILKEWGIQHALLHSGFSTVLALAAPVNTEGWPVSLTHPLAKKEIKILFLSRQAVSGSGRQKGNHIIDPRTGYPATGTLAAWVLAPTAARADALSTAFMVMSSKEAKEYINKHKDISACIIKDKTQRAQRKTLRTQRVINYGQLFESHL